ncbi:MAG: gamma-glutamyltransferase [Proteobacteria bacterium]|nr:gamma-glutamyltransferase [Pseudomonadota bacterium]MBI3499210.1 gamma-glutamyltransferase [Pseudomonadota bacterium]
MTLLRLLLALFLLLPASAGAQPVTAKKHMVATANPMASEAALSVLRDGGSAVDAAIAAQMVLAAVEPQSSGLGGGSLLMVWDAARKALLFYEGLASAPAAVPAELGRAADGSTIPLKALERSARAVAVPGTPRVLAMAHAAHGKLPWARLFRDGIRLAEDGFPMPPYLHGVLAARPELAEKRSLAVLYFANGKPLAVGATVRNPVLAIALRGLAGEGVGAFYTGRQAEHIVGAIGGSAYPGSITYSDLARYEAKRREPVCATVFQHRICTAPPPVSGGIALLQQLMILERAGYADLAPESAGSAHLFIEAARLSQADRRSWLGDPDQVSIPVAGLIEADYIAARARLIEPGHAIAKVEPGSPARRQGALPVSDPIALPATTHVSVVDDWGNAVSFTTTINLNFGSDILAGGVVLNNALTNFAEKSEVDGKRVANAIAPGKRPITAMAPTIVFGEGDAPLLVVGAGGGARIIDSVALTILGVIVWNMDVATAIEQPRIGGQNREEELEAGTQAASLADALRTMGHTPKILEMNAGVQAIHITANGLEGWADPRRDGVALGD